MGCRIQNVNSSYIAKEYTLRSDTNYILTDIKMSDTENYRFDELYEIIDNDAVALDGLTTFKYAEISDVTSEGDVYPVLLDIDERNEMNENYFKKIEKGDIICVKENDILISKIRPYLKKIIFIDESNCDIFYTSAFIHIRPRFSPLILFYILRCHFTDYLNSISRQGKGYPTLNEKDLRFLKFDKRYIDNVISKKELFLSQITTCRVTINQLKKQRIDDTTIINNILGDYFKWDYKKFEEKKKIRIFNTSLASVSKNYDIRFSVKFHRPAGYFVNNEIERSNYSKIKNILFEPIVLGASVSPSDFDSSGEYYYVSMATIKNYKVELDESQLLSDTYVNSPSILKKNIKRGDIIMTRSGAAIGKFALVEEDMKAIHADFTMRIRLKDVNLKFAYFYFRSSYFQYLIEINYKGLQNNNIFPNQVQEFPFPRISLNEQEELSKKIIALLDKQNESELEIKKQNDLIEKKFNEDIV